MEFLLKIVSLLFLVIDSSEGTTMANFDQYSNLNYPNSQPTQSESNTSIERTELIDFSSNTTNSKHYDRGPYFDISASRNVTALVEKTANLNCRIRNLMNRTVSWIRHRDLHLLTVSEATYTSDQRFTCINNKQTGDWTLKVKYAQQRDSGIYECQVSTTPPVGYTMMLSVVEPITTIIGGPDLYIDTGSTVNLTCIVKFLPEPPPVVHWTHNNEEINYDSPRGGVSVITEKGDITTSYLLIQRARKADTGVYTCSPSNANPQSINVHVLSGEQPAAIQKGIMTTKSHGLILFSLFICYCLTVY
ncbi:hypothetical protein ACFFRR_005033 [Megaselia abdita]